VWFSSLGVGRGRRAPRDRISRSGHTIGSEIPWVRMFKDVPHLCTQISLHAYMFSCMHAYIRHADKHSYISVLAGWWPRFDRKRSWRWPAAEGDTSLTASRSPTASLSGYHPDQQPSHSGECQLAVWSSEGGDPPSQNDGGRGRSRNIRAWSY
jgi:hypothetical protein